MSVAIPLAPTVAVEHLTPHDLVTYSRCPWEMTLQHARRRAHLAGSAPEVPTLGGPTLRHSPLFTPPAGGVRVIEGRLDLLPGDTLVYADEGEHGLPVLFPPERVRPDARLLAHGGTIRDDELGLSGRPDFVVRRTDGSLLPIEYKATHLFQGWRAGRFESHGRTFDVVQAIAECRLVHAATGDRPTAGLVLYGDRGAEGAHEGWIEVPYGPAEEHWLRAALAQVRADPIRSPVPTERNCAGCEPNGEGLCRYAAARFERARTDADRALPLFAGAPVGSR
ncbi:MAG TPA: hypothetical protein VMH78_08355 [Thermoplasmata archaeon]|nr:hypothetical protein [Thermoplasmata archaeon]